MNKTLKMDFKNLTFEDLKKYCKEFSADISVMFTPYNKSNERFNLKDFKLFKKEILTISDHGFFEVSKGSENLYLDFLVYLKNDPIIFEPASIQIYTKEDHENLKKIIFEIINQS